MAEYRASVDIEATPEAVFRFLVTEDGITAWLGQWAALVPVPGGEFAVDVVGGEFAVDVVGYPVRGTFLEVDPPRRVTVSWGFAGHEALPPGASTVSFELTPIASGTRVELVHSGLPESELAGHAAGWEHFLSRITRAAVGARLPPDDWRPMP